MTTEDWHAHWRTIIDNQAAGDMNIAAARPVFIAELPLSISGSSVNLIP